MYDLVVYYIIQVIYMKYKKLAVLAVAIAILTYGLFPAAVSASELYNVNITPLNFIPENPVYYSPGYCNNKAVYGYPPDSVLFKHSDDTLSICINNGEHVDIFKTDKGLRTAGSIKIRKIYDKFCGFTSDDQGSYYILFAKDTEDEGDSSSNMALVKYDYNGNITGRFDTGGRDFDVKEPLHGGTGRLLYADGKLGIHMGRICFQGSDGLNHQAGLFLCIDARNMEIISEETVKQTSGHSFDQRTVYYYDSFINLDLGDGYPRGFFIGRKGMGKVVFTYKTSMPDYESPYRDLPPGKWSNDNDTYSQIGGLAIDKKGLVVLGSSEKSLNFANPAADSRNLFMVLVDKDFDRIETDGDMNEVSRQVVISEGEDSPAFSFYNFDGGYEKQKRSGVVWLTNFSDASKNNVVSPKLIALSEGIYAALWENHSSAGYESTFYMLINSEGKVLRNATDLGKLRLSPGDDPININGRIVWVSSTDTGKQLNELMINVDDISDREEIKKENERIINGTLTLPNSGISDKELMFFIDAYSENGTPDNHEDDIRRHQPVTMTKGARNIGFQMTLPYSKSDYMFNYDLLNSSGTGYWKYGYYKPGITQPYEKDGYMVNISMGEKINLTVLEKDIINGSISLPKGEMAPKGGINLYLSVLYSDNSSQSVVAGKYIIIPEGKNSVLYQMQVPRSQLLYSLNFIIADSIPGYLNEGYYGENGTVNSWQERRLFFSSEYNEMNLYVLKGNTIEGNIMLPSGNVAPKGGMSLTVYAKSNNGTDSYYDDYYGYEYLTIPQGESSAHYTISVPEGMSEFCIFYAIYQDEGNYLSRGYYSKGGTIETENYVVNPKNRQSIDFELLPKK